MSSPGCLPLKVPVVKPGKVDEKLIGTWSLTTDPDIRLVVERSQVAGQPDFLKATQTLGKPGEKPSIYYASAEDTLLGSYANIYMIRENPGEIVGSDADLGEVGSYAAWDKLGDKRLAPLIRYEIEGDRLTIWTAELGAMKAFGKAVEDGTVDEAKDGSVMTWVVANHEDF